VHLICSVFVDIKNCQSINFDTENGRETLLSRHEMLRLSSITV